MMMLDFSLSTKAINFYTKRSISMDGEREKDESSDNIASLVLGNTEKNVLTSSIWRGCMIRVAV